MQIAPDRQDAYNIDGVRRTLYSFSVIELWTKGLYFILNVHGNVWGKSCLQGDVNKRFATILVLLVGLVLLTIPRNFVEYRLWRYLRVRAALDPQEGLPDLRSEQINWLYSVMASLFFLAIAMLFLVLRTDIQEVWDLFEFLRGLYEKVYGRT